MHHRIRKLYIYLSAVGLVTILCGLVYLAVQQNYRISANDPQIQMAEDAAAGLTSGQSLQSVLPANKVDLAQSLSPYLIMFDNNGKLIATSADINGQPPEIPTGVFEYVRQKGQDRFTWQPQPGVRQAVVITRFTGPTQGYVLAGRSLREVEKREDNLLYQTAVAWLAAFLFVTFAIVIL